LILFFIKKSAPDGALFLMLEKFSTYLNRNSNPVLIQRPG